MRKSTILLLGASLCGFMGYADPGPADSCSREFGERFMADFSKVLEERDPDQMAKFLDGTLFIPAFLKEPYIHKKDELVAYYKNLFAEKPELKLGNVSQFSFLNESTGTWISDGKYTVSWQDPHEKERSSKEVRYTVVYAPSKDGQCKVIMLRGSHVGDPSADGHKSKKS